MDLKWPFIMFIGVACAISATGAVEVWSKQQTEQKAIEAYGQCITEHAPNVKHCNAILDRFGYARD